MRLEAEVMMALSFFYLLYNMINTEMFQIFPCWYALINMFLF